MRQILWASLVALCVLSTGVGFAEEPTDEEIENIVRRSYQYVAMFNTNNNFAMQQGNPSGR